VAVAPVQKSTGRARIRWGRHLEGYLVISPWLIGFVAFTAGPMIASAYLSLTRYDLLSPPVWIGTENFSRMIDDDLFPTALFNTLYYTVFAVPAQVAVALIMAMALNRQIRGIGFFRAAFYLPTVMPTVASVMLWLWILNPDLGVANALFRLVGQPGLNWLTDPNLAKPSLILMSLWRVGGQMVIFLAGLQSVPETLYEAAAIDGANRFQRFLNVTIPMISPVIFFNVIVGIIDSFQVFTTAFIATGGGPVNSTYFYVLHLYDEGFSNFHMGYASALAWVLFALVLAFTFGQFVLGRQWVYYEGGERR
jgi:multiple sugar transport system permease protein